MPYIDKNFILDSIDNVTLTKLTGGDDARITKKVAAADSMIDSALRSQTNELPLLNPPEIIKQMSYFLTIYFLYERVAFDERPEDVKNNYDIAIDYIDKIAKGKVNLFPDIPEEKIESSTETGGFDFVMTRKLP